MSMDQVYALRGHDAAAYEKSVAIDEREKDVNEILWCEDCQKEFPPEEYFRHPRRSHIVDICYKCLSCGDRHIKREDAFNCCAEDWIKR